MFFVFLLRLFLFYKAAERIGRAMWDSTGIFVQQRVEKCHGYVGRLPRCFWSIPSLTLAEGAWVWQVGDQVPFTEGVAFRTNAHTIDMPSRAGKKWTNNSPKWDFLLQIISEYLRLLCRWRQILFRWYESVRTIETDSESFVLSLDDITNKRLIEVNAKCFFPRTRVEK